MAGGFAAKARSVSERGAVARDPLATEPLNAPLFHALMQRLEAGGRWVVLDLGAARADTIRTFSQFRCRLTSSTSPTAWMVCIAKLIPGVCARPLRSCCYRVGAKPRTSCFAGT